MTSNLRPLRLGEEKKKKEDRNHRAKIKWSAVIHRAITLKIDTNHRTKI